MTALEVSWSTKIRGRFYDFKGYIIKTPTEPSDHILILQDRKVVQVCQLGRQWERYYKILKKEARIPQRVLQDARKWVIANGYRRWCNYLFRIGELSTQPSWEKKELIRKAMSQKLDQSKLVN